MKEGTVKFYDKTKGFGFISPDNGGADVFVHETGLIDKVKDNDRVQFFVEQGKKGPNAVKVEVVK